jgi:hypothetical protein
MLNMNSHELKHALIALISVVTSTSEGVIYITHTQTNPKKQNLQIVEKLVYILRDLEDGSVTQRFNIAAL